MPSPYLGPGDLEVQEAIRRWRELLEAARSLPVTPIRRELTMIERSLKLFIGNAAELRATMDGHQTLARFYGLGDSGGQEQLERDLDEIDRLLHNFLAASYTISAFTQKCRKKVNDPQFDALYESRNPHSTPEAKLVQELRNVTQHHRLPSLVRKVQILTGPPLTYSCAYAVSASALEELRERCDNSATRAYIDGLAGELILGDLVDAHALRVEQFAKWFVAAVIESRAAEFATLDDLRHRAELVAQPLDQFFKTSLHEA